MLVLLPILTSCGCSGTNPTILSTQWVPTVTKSRSKERRRRCTQIFSRNTSQEMATLVQEYPRFPTRRKMILTFRLRTTRKIIDIIITLSLVLDLSPKVCTWGQKENAADIKFVEALTPHQNRGLQLMIQRFSEIFSDRPGDTNLAEQWIDLTSDEPMLQTSYPVRFAQEGATADTEPGDHKQE